MLRAPAGLRSQRLLPLVGALALVVLMAVAPQPAAPQESDDPAGDDPQAARETVLGRKADLAAEIDVLTADEAQLRAAVAGLDAEVRVAEAQLADANRNAEGARAEAELAGTQAEEAAAWLDVVRKAVSRMAVDAYVHPPGETQLGVLESVEGATDEAMKKTFLEGRTGRDVELLDELRRATAELEDHQRRAATAEAAAAESATQIEAKLGQLDAARSRQEGLAVDVQARLDARLAEADALEAIDAELAAQIRSDELALVASLPLPPVTTAAAGGGGGGSAADPGGSSSTTSPSAPGTTSTTRGGGSTATTRPPATSPPTTRPPATSPPTTRPPATSPPTTRPPTTSPPTTRPTGGPVIVSVRGIWVNQTIATNLDRMLAAAEASGIVLRGGGYRDPASQIALRKAHCGPTEYDIWHKPSSQCTPPTAPPGRSMHEQGLAIDFTYGGRVITSRSSPAFVWLAANAASYGFYNLPSEPWHWSINGH